MKEYFKNPFFIAGFSYLIISLVISFLGTYTENNLILEIQNINYTVGGLINVVAIIFLFLKEYRHIGKGWLIGLFAPAVIIFIISVIVTFASSFFN